MSVNFDGIDLNSDVVSVERNSEVYGVSVSERTVGDIGSATETLTEHPLGVGRVDGSSMEGVSGNIRVFREVKDSVEAFNGDDESLSHGGVVGGLVGEGLEGRNESVDRGNNIEQEMKSVDRENDTKVADIDDSLFIGDGSVAAFVSGGVTVDELSISEMEVETRVDTNENRVVGVCDSEAGVSQQMVDESNMISLVVDLNPCIRADGNQKSGYGISDEGTRVEEFSGDVGIPFSAHLTDNAACRINGVGIDGNRDVENKDQVTDIEDIKKKNVKPAALKQECYGKGGRTEKEGEFYVSDLVWGKVRSHPWWPGQIFDPSDSSEKAMKYYKKDSLLIAYFGDQSFAWNEASRIKPFRMHFSQMEKQSTFEAFCHAVECALDEVSRRVEFGLACSCLSEEVYAKIKSQIIVNAGIREESSRRHGGDELSSVDYFKPLNLVQYLIALARSPSSGIDRLEFVIARAQLLAFNRWKGNYQLPEFKILGGLLENDVNIPLLGQREDSDEVVEVAVPVSKDNEQVPSGKGKSVKDNSSRKRERIAGDVVYPSKKEKRMSDLMSGSHSNLPNGENEPERKAGRKSTSSSSVKKRKAVDSIFNDSTVKNRKSLLSPETNKPFLRIGETIRKVASQLAVSTPILKSQKTVGENGSNKKRSRASFNVPPCNSEKSQRRKVIPAEYPPPDEMLSQLCLSARDPMKGNSFLISIVSFFSDFRNSFCLDNSNSRRHKESTVKRSAEQTVKKSSNSETTETSGLEGMEDSYWTDRIIQSYPEEQVLFEPETSNEKGSPTVEPEAAIESTPKSDSKQESAVVNHELEAGKPTGVIYDKCEQEYSPTALILNFTDLDSVPSETNLNKIFSRYGPLNESETEVLKKSNRAKVVFKRRSDADTAFSSAGKFSIFGPSLVSYRLNYSPTPRKSPTSATKGVRKDATFAEGNAV